MSQEAEKILFWSEDQKLARYVKFVIYKTGAVQCAELEFIDKDGASFEWPIDAMTFVADHLYKNSGVNADTEWLENLCNNKYTGQYSKYYGRAESPGTVTYDLGSNCLDVVRFNRYQLWNDDCYTYGRGFESWDLLVSADGENFIMLDSQRNANVNRTNSEIRFTSQEFQNI